MAATSPTHPSEVRHERTTYASSTTAGQDMRLETTIGRGSAADMGEISETGGKVSRSTVRKTEERDTESENDRIGGQAERTESGE